MIVFKATDFPEMEKRYRTTLINSIGGFKSLCLCGTTSPDGVNNLSVISSVVHVGANPPLQGFIMRPTSVERQTYEYIKSTGFFTLNHVSESFYQKAHQCAARYDRKVSEFEEVGLTPSFSENIVAPYVAESSIKMGFQLEEEHFLGNGTIFVIGKLQELIVENECLQEDGFLNLAKAGSLTVSGLDAYSKTMLVGRLSYPKPNQSVEKIQ